MATMFGRFEIQSELSKSETALIYKALDTETNQVVALKTQNLEPLGERAEAFVEALLAEGEATRELASQNIVPLYGAGEMDGQFCAAMEYIQGNSVATMIARNEGFSIWDLLDITRQVCTGLDKAAEKGVTHNSLEPQKILVQWDGMVKILGYGISNMSLIGAESGKGLGRLMPYCSPEQIRGETIDLRSNVFTVGAILYEMVTGRKAFDAADPETLVDRIQNEEPARPDAVNAKIHPAVSALIMKALVKDPAGRYQTAQELVADLEKCKETSKKAPEAKRPVQAPKVAVDPAARAAAASKFTTAASAPASEQAKPAVTAAPRAAAPAVSAPSMAPKVAAAAAGASAGTSFATNSVAPSVPSEDAGVSEELIGFEISPPSSPSRKAAMTMSAAPAAPAVEQEGEQSGGIAVDPMMAGGVAKSSGKSFSDLDELPPMKQPVFTPPPPEPPVEQTRPVKQLYPRPEKENDEKPKVQVREVADKAMKEISTIPPRLMLFAIAGAVVLIAAIAVAVFFHVHSEDDDTAAPKPTKAAKQEAAPAPVKAEGAAKPVEQAPVPAPAFEPQPNLGVRQVEKRAVAKHAPAPAPVPMVVPGQAMVDSIPQGVPFQVDGKSDPAWVTPFAVVNLAPGKHIISLNKQGYSPEIRSIDVAAGSKASLQVHLAPINALIVVNSTPAGADITIDGKPTGKVTPAQFAVEKGSHAIFLKKQGYLDETTVTELSPGQNFQFAPALRALGNIEDMKTVGKFNKLFGHGGDSTAGMGSISIHTQPKGAQVSINQRMLDKLTPVDVMLGPGNYIVDVTLTGFKPIHKVVNVDKGGKAAVDEVMERQ